MNDLNKNSFSKVDSYFYNKIEVGDVLKIDISTIIPEASMPYQSIEKNQVHQSNNLDILIINGYTVDKNSEINYPVLGKISVLDLSEEDLAYKIKTLLINNGHLTDPHVKVKKINSKFTVLGEVNNPGTFSFYDDKLNIFQALGISGDLLISANRNNITLVREENGLRKVFKFSLNKSVFLDKSYYNIKNNDIIIVEPNFSKIKSAGFIGSPSSIASISSLVLSITLLLINNINNN